MGIARGQDELTQGVQNQLFHKKQQF
jgi:hypothetical protein